MLNRIRRALVLLGQIVSAALVVAFMLASVYHAMPAGAVDFVLGLGEGALYGAVLFAVIVVVIVLPIQGWLAFCRRCPTAAWMIAGFIYGLTGGGRR